MNDEMDGTAEVADDCAACGDCPALRSRRDFLRDALTAAAAVALAGVAGKASAMPVGWTTAIAARGDSRSYSIPAQDGAEIDKENEVILVRWQGAVYAFNLSCPHQRTALRWQASANQFQCPKHHSRYRPDGTFVSGRATRGMDRLAISREGGAVRVDLNSLIKQTDDPAAWNAAVIHV